MISFGFVTIYPNQEKAYATEIAKRAKDFNIHVYRFVPTSIEPGTDKAKGEFYNSSTQSWEKTIFDIPTYLYDRCFYSDDLLSKKSKPIMNWLKIRPQTTFLGQGLPNKWDIYNSLIKDHELAPYIPKTERVETVLQILHKIVKKQQLILKPETGSMGKGIVGVFHRRNHVEVIYEENENLQSKQFHTRNELSKWLEQLFSSQSYLVQPFLPLQDEHLRPFDIRILLQKNENGEWQETGRGMRIGTPRHITSNISNGGTIECFQDWVKKMTINQQSLLNDNINTIINKLPDKLEKNFKDLFEIGIDLGYEKDGSLWILDTNSKPGRKVPLKTSPEKIDEIYTIPLRYCTYLHSRTPAKRS